MNNKGINKLSDVDKRDLFARAKQRTEREKLLNTGIKVPVGDTEIIIKSLDWETSNQFEDKLLELVKEFNDISVTDVTKGGLYDLVAMVVRILRKDIIELLTLGTNGELTIDYIKEHRGTKDDIIKLLIEVISLNYSYLKNLVTLTRQL